MIMAARIALGWITPEDVAEDEDEAETDQEVAEEDNAPEAEA